MADGCDGLDDVDTDGIKFEGGAMTEILVDSGLVGAENQHMQQLRDGEGDGKGGHDATWQIYIPDVVRMCRRTDDTMTRHVMSDKLDYRTDIR